MKFRFLAILLLAFMLITTLDSCKSQQKRGGKQPRRGAIPCPIKDC